MARTKQVGCKVSDAVRTLRRDTWVRPFLRKYARTMVLALLLGVVAYVFAAALMFTSGWMISLAAALPFTVLALHVPSLFVRIFGIGKPVLGYLERLRSHDWILRVTSELRRRLFDAFACRPAFASGLRRTGEVLGVLTEDIGHMQDLYLRTAFPLATAWAVCALAVFALGVFSWQAAILMLLLLLVQLVLIPLVAASANGVRLMRRQAIASRLYDDLTDNVLGVSDWVYSGRQEDYLDRFAEVQLQLEKEDERLRTARHARDVAGQIVLGICAVVVLVWACEAFAQAESGAANGAVAALANVASKDAPAFGANWIAAFALCFFPLIEAFAPVPSAVVGMVEHAQSVSRLNQIDGSRAMVPDASEKPDFDAEFAVEIDGVAYSYGTGPRVLDDVTLKVRPGEKIAVLGRSGAGKSSLVSLVRGQAVPVAGTVRVMGADPVRLGENIAGCVGVITQNPHVFNATLRDNLLIARTDASDEELLLALESVGLRSLIERLPKGLSTLVAESGIGFSGGERHRIALARVLLARTPVVVLDEPFSGLDPATERMLAATMFDVFSDAAVIMVTHHLQGVSRCDRVVFLEDGAVSMSGAPSELKRNSDRFAKLLAFDRGFDA